MGERRRLLLTTFAVAILGFGAACSRPNEERETESRRSERELVKATRGPLTVRLFATDASVRLGDRVAWRLVLTAERPVRLDPYRVPARAGHFRVRGKPELKLQGQTDEAAFEVEPERSGPNLGQLPPLHFSILDGEGAGRQEVLHIPGFEIAVEGPGPDTEATLKGISALPDLVELGVRGGPSRMWWYLGGAALVVFAAVLLLCRRAAPVLAAPPIDPKEEARRALEVLLSAGHLEAARFDAFYVGLTGIVRTFVERTTTLAAPDLTTEEFLREAAQRQLFSPEAETQFGRFLEAADLVKYAGQIPGRADHDRAVQHARVFCGLEVDLAAAGGRA